MEIEKIYNKRCYIFSVPDWFYRHKIGEEFIYYGENKGSQGIAMTKINDTQARYEGNGKCYGGIMEFARFLRIDSVGNKDNNKFAKGVKS